MWKITDPDLIRHWKVIKGVLLSSVAGLIIVTILMTAVVSAAWIIFNGLRVVEKIGYKLDEYVHRGDTLILGAVLLVVIVFAAVIVFRDVYNLSVHGEVDPEKPPHKAPSSTKRSSALPELPPEGETGPQRKAAQPAPRQQKSKK